MLALAAAVLPAAEPAPEWQRLAEENRRLQEQVRAQQRTIEELMTRVGELARASERQERELAELGERLQAPPPAPAAPGRRGDVRVSAEAGIGYFKTGSDGQFSASSFRVDDPMIMIEAPVARDVYFYTELKLLPRETNAENFELGELYVDFENVSALWGQPGLLSVRAGRMQVPFGEEYLVRGPMANPLISHSLADIWGIDEGVEIYGRLGPARYVLAVQNGGMSRLRDFNSDKAVTGRLSWDPWPGLHLSLSGMTTGRLDAVADNLSEVWIGNGFFRSIGNGATTATFWADLAEVDAAWRWRNGHLGGAIGRAWYDDSDTTTDNARRLDFGHAELVQDLSAQVYAAARYSAIRAPRGYPLPGWGRLGTFFFRPIFTTELERLSLGLGYRIAAPLILKVEYARESGSMANGDSRDQENFFGTELAVKF